LKPQLKTEQVCPGLRERQITAGRMHREQPCATAAATAARISSALPRRDSAASSRLFFCGALDEGTKVVP
jgi:hypothetical protein